MDALVDSLFRRQAGRLAGMLTRQLGPHRLTLAEDAVQDALLKALQTWPLGGVPDNPTAWLYQVARRSALDRLRHERVVADKAGAVAAERPSEADDPRLPDEATPFADDELVMMFLTCHPALAPEARVALTLKVVGGFGVGEIARAFLMQAPAVAQRLVRAKRTLREFRVPFALPARHAVAERLASVLDALYLMFSEGHAPTAGPQALKEDVAEEAMRLVTLLARHADTARPETHALRALMLLHAARFPGRVVGDDLQLLATQDRSTWDGVLLAEGLRALDRAATGPEETRFHLEAAIAAAHAAAPSWAATDWPAILSLYDALVARWPSPVAALNRVIAFAQVFGAAAALDEAAPLVSDPRLARYHRLPAVLADLHARAGNPVRAAALFDEALGHEMAAPERRLLESRRAALRGL
ncbi:MAG: RNA polymerase sigma factor [Vicinamibacterales bacterium]